MYGGGILRIRVTPLYEIGRRVVIPMAISSAPNQGQEPQLPEGIAASQYDQPSFSGPSPPKKNNSIKDL